MTIQGKVWGKTQKILAKNNFEIHRIEIDQGGYCSKHKHTHKFNAFFVEEGMLEVTIWKNDYDLVDATEVAGGELTVVRPGEYHMFNAITDVICYEIYWTELDENDIQRETCGGINNNEEIESVK